MPAVAGRVERWAHHFDESSMEREQPPPQD